MIRPSSLTFSLLAMLLAFTVVGGAKTAKVDQPAPAFTLTDSDGNRHSLSDFKGKYVVLEWVNYDCPFVMKHYGSGNMPALQEEYTGKDVVWLSICSSAPGKQGHFETAALKERMKKEKAAPTAYLIDEDGTVGKMYEARTTPHMYIINPEGTLVYAGGIDNMASTNKDDIPKATNYVREGLNAALEGKTIATKTSKPYGCSVKYK